MSNAKVKMIVRDDPSRADNGEQIGEINESSRLWEMERDCPLFFKTPHGKRETFTVYRGQLITRSTDVHTSGGPVRRTAVFLFFPKGYATETSGPELHAASSGSNVNSTKQAERLIDRIIDNGTYHYGI